MMRKWIAGTTAAALLLGAPIFPAQQSARAESPFTEDGPVAHWMNRWAVTPETSQAPVIDGVLDEALWSGAAVLDDFRNVYSYEPADGNAAYRIVYDSGYLYIGGSFSLDEMETLSRVELVFSAASAGSLHQVASIPVQPQRTMTTEWFRSVTPQETPQRIDLSGFAHASSVQALAETYSLEAAIPLASLSSETIAPGDEWRMNIIHIHEPNTKPISSWTPIRNARYMDRYGTGTIAYSANVVDQGRLGSLFFGEPAQGSAWQPQQAELLFTGMEQKALVFEQDSPAVTDFDLYWKTPSGDWQQLPPPTVNTNGTETTLAFAYPAPLRDGMYQLRVIAASSVPGDVRQADLMFDREQLIAAGTAALGYERPSGVGSTPVTPAPASSQVLTALNLIPDKVGFRYVGLPERPDLAPDGLYTLSADGQSIIAKSTSTVYPNALYPETQSVTAKNRDGDDVVYPYYEDGQGRKYFISGHLWYLQRARALVQTDTISKTDPLGAARLLYRFAQAYETYVPTSDERWHTLPINITAGPPFNYWGGTWERWNLNDLNNLRPLLRAYERVRQTNALAVLSTELGVDVEQKIVEEMFLPSFDYVFSFPITLANMDKSLWFGLIEAGKALGQPEYIHKAAEWMKDYAEQRFMTDGSWYEVTVSYHNQATDGLADAIAMLQGYSDPPGYVSPRSGVRFDNLDLYDEYPILEKALAFPKQLAYPNGKVVPVQDTWGHSAETPAPDAGAVLLPSAKIARLTSGTGSTQTQLYMQFTPKYGHNHFDPLSLNLFTHGQELLPDLGYSHSKYRYFTVSTLGHNTVTVNSRNMTASGDARDGGKIERFVAEGLFQAMRASQQEAYAETDEYSREPWLVPFPGASGESYTIDLFRVSGGDRHEYTLQGDADRDAVFRTDAPLTYYGERLLPPGVTATEALVSSEGGSAEGHYPGYIYVKDVYKADLTGDRFSVELDTSGSAGKLAGLRITGLLDSGANELYLGRSPSIRTTRMSGPAGDDNDSVSLYDMPKLVLRRDGTDLSSTFVTLLEPYGSGSAPRIEAFDRIVPDQAPDGAAVIRVAYGDTIDWIVSNPRNPQQPIVAGDLSMTGEMGFIRQIDGAVVEMRLVNGTLLQKGGAQLTGAADVTGAVTGTKRIANGDEIDALLTDVAVPTSAAGETVIVTHPDGTVRGYPVADVIHTANGSELVLDGQDPGFTLDGSGGSELNYYPATRWSGSHTLRVGAPSFYAGPPIPDTSPVGAVSGTVYDPYDSPLAGAVVYAAGYAGRQTTSDGSGHFLLTNVPAGAQRIVAKKAGYAQGISETVNVQFGQTASRSVRLAAELPPSLDVTAYAAVGSAVYATVDKTADLYLVPAATAPEPAAIIAAAGTAGTAVYGASAGVPAMLDTAGLATGAYSVYAIDLRGQLSSGSPVRLLVTDRTVVEDNDEDVVYSGSWTPFSNTVYSGGTVKRAQTAGASAAFGFYGSAIRVLGSTSTNNGFADIYIDDVLQATVDTYSATTKYQQLLYESPSLGEGVHTVRIVATGDKRSAANNAYVTLDAVQIVHENQMPFSLEGASAGAMVIGEPAQATSPRNGMLYLVPADTAAKRTAIETAGTSANGRAVAVTADVYGTLDTTGLSAGWYRLYGVSGAGVVSSGSDPLALVAPVPTVLIEDDDSLVRYAGTWRTFTNTAYSGGTVRRAESSGAYAEIPFYGSSVSLIGSLSFNNGQARVYIDGVYQTTVDVYNPTIQYQQTFFTSGPLSPGAHVLRLEAAWTRHASSSGYFVSLDALMGE